MDLRLSDEQEQLVEAFRSLYAKRSSAEQVREAEPAGFDRELWAKLFEMGVVEMAVDVDHGGWGASPLDLALVAEQHGIHVAPAPVIETQVAARLLARVDSPFVERAISGERMVTIGLHPASVGVARGVPAAACADDAIVLVDDRLLLVPLEGAVLPFENLGSMPLADVAVDNVGSDGVADVLATGADARAAFDAAIDDYLLLTAAALVGIATRSLELGVEYVTERQAFGVPIGSFQAVSHRLADSAAAIDGARLLAYEAAWAAESDTARATELAALAFAFATDTARDASYRSLHFHGGYGFMMEYTIQLYWRRARAWGAVWGDSGLAYERAADARYGRR